MTSALFVSWESPRWRPYRVEEVESTGGGEWCFGDTEGSLGHLGGGGKLKPRGREAEASEQRPAGSSNLAPTAFPPQCRPPSACPRVGPW